MKRIFVHLSRGSLLLIACLAIVWLLSVPESVSAVAKQPSTTAPGTEQTGRLVILRSASLGPTIVGLKVDGEQTARITFNRRYEGPVAAGEHTLTVYPVITYEGSRPTQRRVKIEPGKTYTFTVVRKDIQLFLK